MIADEPVDEEIALIVQIATKSGQARCQLDAFEALAPLVRREPGCIEYQLHQDCEIDERFVLTERWASPSRRR